MKKIITTGSIALAFGMLAACNPKTPEAPTDPSTMSSSSSSLEAMPTSSSSSTSDVSGTAWKWDGKLVAGKHQVVLKTSKGDIALELNADIAPKTVTNFMALASSGYYNGVTFHRVIPGFMIQGGDPSGNGTGGKSVFGDTFEDEIAPDSETYKVGYRTGVVAMANRGPNTNGSQFFIMDADNPLPPSYTIFGYVTSGQEVVSAIARVPRDASDMPNEKVSFDVVVVQ